MVIDEDVLDVLSTHPRILRWDRGGSHEQKCAFHAGNPKGELVDCVVL